MFSNQVFSIHLQFIPSYDNGTYLGAKCMMTLWNASSDDVWCTGDNLHMSLQNWDFVNKEESFSLAFESKGLNKKLRFLYHDFWTVWCYNNLRLLNHFFFLSRPLNFPCAHLGNFFLFCLCLLCMWLSRDSHFASIVSLSPSGVEETHQ